MDLADELLLDLEGDEQVEEEEIPQNDAEEAFAVPSLPASASISKKRKASEEPEHEDSEMLVDLPEGGQRPAEELDADAVEEMDLLSTADVSKVAKLFTQKSFQDALTVRLFFALFAACIPIVCSLYRKSKNTRTFRLQTCLPLNQQNINSSCNPTTLL